MNATRRIAVLTGSRADFGLLRSVMLAIHEHSQLELCTIVTGTHLLQPDRTIDEVAATFTIDCSFEMQQSGEHGRIADAAAFGRGATALAQHLPALNPDVLLVLGDRIEAFASAAAASIAGVRVAHMHGGDRAQGVADEAMRHAISKLAHIHLPATQQSADRLARMGEDATRIHIVGSPAIDDLDSFSRLDDEQFEQLGRPDVVVLMHPVGCEDSVEAQGMRTILKSCANAGNVLVLDPNHDPGRVGIIQAIQDSGLTRASHLPRSTFIALLRRAHLLIGNSSAGLIEAAALGLPAINIGSRQAGREKPASVMDVATPDEAELLQAITTAMQRGTVDIVHPYGNGSTGRRTAVLLADFDPAAHPITKRNTF